MPARIRILDRVVEISPEADPAGLLSHLYRHMTSCGAPPDARLDLRRSGPVTLATLQWPGGEHAALSSGPQPIAGAHRLLLEHTLGEAADVWVLHAGAVALNGRALLLLGESWAGKTTLVSALVARGGALLSDDYAPVRASDLCVVPFPRALGVRAGRVDPLAPPLLARRWVDPVTVAALAPDPVPIGGLVVLEESTLSAPPATLRPLTPAQTLVHLLQALRNPQTCPDPVPHLAALAARVPAAALARGPLDEMARVLLTRF